MKKNSIIARTLLLWLILMNVSVLMVSCSNDDDASPNIQGRWYESYSTNKCPAGYEFKANGTGLHFYNNVNWNFTWTLIDSRLTIIHEKVASNLDGTWIVVSIENDEMTLLPVDGSVKKVLYRNQKDDNGENDSMVDKEAPYTLFGKSISMSYNGNYDKFRFTSSSTFKCDYSYLEGTYSYTRINNTTAKLTMTVKQQVTTITRTMNYNLTLTFNADIDDDWDFLANGTHSISGGLSGNGTFTVKNAKGYFIDW